MNRTTLQRLQREIADLRQKDAAEAKREVDATMKANKAAAAAAQTRSTTTMKSKVQEAERYQSQAANAAKKRADIAREIARKSGELNQVQVRLSKAEEAQAKKDTQQLERLSRELFAQQRAFKNLPAGLATYSAQSGPVSNQSRPIMRHDVFISHASEDKDSFVRPFAEALSLRGLAIWYDEHSLKWGDSLRREIDRGLSNSRFGVVVLSKHFFSKKWPQTELDGLMAKEMNGDGRILPIWHSISKDEVLAASPILGNKLALNTSVQTIEEISDQLVSLCRS